MEDILVGVVVGIVDPVVKINSAGEVDCSLENEGARESVDLVRWWVGVVVMIEVVIELMSKMLEGFLAVDALLFC